jgi:hypothetical protein
MENDEVISSMEDNSNQSESENPNHVETFIDACRLNGDWDNVLSGIKRYAHIFDIGAATFTAQHASLDSVRAYYWVCMAETVYQTKGDYMNAIDCAKRAVGIDVHCVEARIIIARMLIEKCRYAFNVNEEVVDFETSEFGVEVVDLDPGSVLSEPLKVA